MIALDSSAIVAIALPEPEEAAFARLIVERRAIVAAPTLVETGMVLSREIPGFADASMRRFVSAVSVEAVAFTTDLYEAAWIAFKRFGKGRDHPAQLNLVDCLSYAVARVHGVPLVFKGRDFARTDLLPAYVP